MISLSHSSKVASEKDDLIMEKSLLIGLMRITEGNPEFNEKISCNS
jgi:hypothetical protein